MLGLYGLILFQSFVSDAQKNRLLVSLLACQFFSETINFKYPPHILLKVNEIGQ